METKTSLDKKILIFKEYLKRFEEISTILGLTSKTQHISNDNRVKYDDDIDWCSKNYLAIREAETDMQVTYPSGTKTEYPIIWSFLSKFQSIQSPNREDIDQMKTSYLALKAQLGFLESKRQSIGEIKIEEYQKLKSLIETYKLESSAIDSLFSLSEECKFLELDFSWILSTIALQLQEVAMTLMAEKLGIALDKSGVSKILGRQIEGELSFRDRYAAFCTEIKKRKDTTLSMLPSDLRGIRTRVLHEGKSPQANEAKLLVDFTCSFLKELQRVLQ